MAEEEMGGVEVQPRVSSAAPFPAPTATATATAVAVLQCQRYGMELTPGDTTIVSWKKLLRDAGKGNGAVPEAAAPTGSHPALESVIGTAPASDHPAQCELMDGEPSANRFSAVIEKIERLYMGKESSDEEVFDDVPDDDQYDTDDSFIDDAELNDYFQVDKSATKHSGFYVNRGKLESLERSSSPNTAPMKRRRKYSTNHLSERGDGHMPSAHFNTDNVKMKAAARNAPLVVKKSSSLPSHYGEAYQERKNKNKSSMLAEVDKTINVNVSSFAKPQSKILALTINPKDFEKQKDAFTHSRNLPNKSKVTRESLNSMHESHYEKGSSSQVDLQFKKPLKGDHDTETSKKLQHRDNGIEELPDLNSPGTGRLYPIQTVKEQKRVKEGAIRPKGTTLERAIRDLEKIVTESRPQKLDLQVVTTPQGVKKRLPLDIKQKLAKVARLADTQGKIASVQFLDRLMGILGHLVQPKTLKRHLKEMVVLGLSVKQAKADRFQQLKKEVTEIIKTRVASLTSKVAEKEARSSNDFQELPGQRAFQVRCIMDDAIEDKVCDLYDLYVEGMDEDRGPQARKLYVELAELWPPGYMDNVGIKDAVYRAKERKRDLHRQKTKIQEENRIKRKNLSSSVRMEENVRSNSQARAGQDSSASDSAGQVSGIFQRGPSSQVPSSSGKLSDPIPSSNADHALKHHDRVRSSNASVVSDGTSKALITMRKNIKRKPEADLDVIQVHSPKLPSHRGDLKDKSQKCSSNTGGITRQEAIVLALGLPESKEPN